ncbi:carcinoembryonic antigen-related cell adhesion molecule 1-like [Sinocyclocheilus grahami]|uniref:carcinoembryonic antigen-related cell adhesion molecule 1-like n=1 Tax=Sinocyclocheilus grahami TaxID=75366 RepID=UPI0007AD5482|nr:PREDICTED: carcinoembryonic antigen-related cell adhesion molecule 1-like [Sinocyclocheilus grahami]
MNSAVLWTLVNVLLVLGVSGVGADEELVFVMEGDSVTLHTNIEANQQGKIRWYFSDTQVAAIIEEKREICTDDQCRERFRDRLKLDHQTGSLTITNTRNTDAGVYIGKVINRGSFSDKIFSVSVHDVPERDEMKGKSVKEGESVTLDPGVVKNLNGVMTWYFNDILITEITGDQRKICTDDQCRERFRDRLKLHHQTGSLTITHTRTTDSGDYKLQISSSRISISRTSAVLTVIDSGLSPGAIAGIVVVAVVLSLIAAVAAVFLYARRIK